MGTAVRAYQSLLVDAVELKRVRRAGEDEVGPVACGLGPHVTVAHGSHGVKIRP
jgi:hypothetical protein